MKCSKGHEFNWPLIFAEQEQQVTIPTWTTSMAAGATNFSPTNRILLRASCPVCFERIEAGA